MYTLLRKNRTGNREEEEEHYLEGIEQIMEEQGCTFEQAKQIMRQNAEEALIDTYCC